ncbi:hypothetical protein ACFL09_01450 [Planctomycetota bacterium]
MEMKELAAKTRMESWADEIERSIDNVKRTKLDKWMRREWHKAGARSHWSADRKARWEEWR